jgi:hypothetical protein
VEINKTKTRRTKKRINKTKSGLCENTNKIGKFLAKLTKRKRSTQIKKAGVEKG